MSAIKRAKKLMVADISSKGPIRSCTRGKAASGLLLGIELGGIMGQRGPSRTPTKILQLRGSWRAKTRQNEPYSKPRSLSCPQWLSPAAKRIWRVLAPRLAHLGLLTTCDEHALGRYCELWVCWLWCRKELYDGLQASAPEGAERIKALLTVTDRLLRLEREFGLTPAARASLATEHMPAVSGEKAEFFKANG